MTTAVTPVTPPKQIPVTITEEVWNEAGLLPCQISVDLRLKRFTVRDLLRLDVGVILETANADGGDVPVTVNAQLIGWAEFEIVGQRIAVRMTEVG
jgi:flagellar motor switch/type III secretory pathway protein FliN